MQDKFLTPFFYDRCYCIAPTAGTVTLLPYTIQLSPFAIRHLSHSASQNAFYFKRRSLWTLVDHLRSHPISLRELWRLPYRGKESSKFNLPDCGRHQLFKLGQVHQRGL